MSVYTALRNDSLRGWGGIDTVERGRRDGGQLLEEVGKGQNAFLPFGRSHDLHANWEVVRIRTADTDFHQFGFLTVTNPLVEPPG